jgi:hypothetical protein
MKQALELMILLHLCTLCTRSCLRGSRPEALFVMTELPWLGIWTGMALFICVRGLLLFIDRDYVYRSNDEL